MFGISVYPYKEKQEETLNYIELAATYGFKRVFTNLLLLEDGKIDETLKTMKTAIHKARECGMEVILDVNPAVFEQLNISYKDLTFFKEMGATGIRLDETFDGMAESMMTFDPAGMDIEINLSQDTAYVENILSFSPNKKRIIGSHNFYPQRFTGLDFDYFMRCSTRYKKMGIRTAAFVNSHDATHGPHPHDDGLCTLEMHRDMDIVTQAKHLFATGLIDDIIIANAFASEDELRRLGALSQEQLELDVVLSKHISPLEKEIVIDNPHVNRGDINSYSIRSTQVRVKYKDEQVPQNNAREELGLGDITIGNDSFGQYKAELNLVKQAMPNLHHHKNVVAHVVDEEEFLIDYIKPWERFLFRSKA